MAVARGSDISGQRFGRWLVLELSSTDGYIKRYLCKCDCGVLKSVVRAQLISGSSKSCGCLRTEMVVQRSTKHGMYHTPEYRVYTSMVNRCTNPNYHEYHSYGGRGIKVSHLWSTFDRFYADVGARPEAGMQLDRRDNDKDYEPGNVKWSTKVENARNKRNTVWVMYQNEKITLKEVSEKSGIPYSALFYRYQRGDRGEDLVVPSGSRPRTARIPIDGFKIIDDIQIPESAPTLEAIQQGLSEMVEKA